MRKGIFKNSIPMNFQAENYFFEFFFIFAVASFSIAALSAPVPSVSLFLTALSTNPLPVGCPDNERGCPGRTSDSPCGNIREHGSEIGAIMTAFPDAGLQFSKRDRGCAAILFQDLEFSLDIQFADLVGFQLVVSAEFSLDECGVIEGLGAEQADDETYRFCIGSEEIVLALRIRASAWTAQGTPTTAMRWNFRSTTAFLSAASRGTHQCTGCRPAG